MALALPVSCAQTPAGGDALKRALVIFVAVATLVAATAAGVWALHRPAARTSASRSAVSDSPAPTPAATPSAIATENARAGSTTWHMGLSAPRSGVEGYASRTSIAAGEGVDVFVRTEAARVTPRIYRMGYYAGAGGRLIAQLPTFAGSTQSRCEVTDYRHMVTCAWTRSFRMQTTSAWTSGVYLIKLIASDGSQSLIPIVVRELVPRAPIVFQTSVTTWQAYNSWGGRSLYTGPCIAYPHASGSPSPGTSSPGSSPSSQPSAGSPKIATKGSPSPSSSASASPSSSASASPSSSASPSVSPSTSPQPHHHGEGGDCGFNSRSRAVSFDRPYSYPGDGQFFRFEFPLLYWMESQGYDMAYATDVDLHENNEALASRKIFVSAGHDEYYSSEMRASLETTLGTGVNLAFFGANDIYRQIRFEPSPLGDDRIEVNYKDASDPIYKTDRTRVTTQWREFPLYEPEQALLGAQYECNPVRADWIATGEPAWLYRETGFVAGDTITNLVGYEYDHVMPGFKSPDGVTLVAHSPVFCGRRTASDTVFYVSSSGAAVFDAGSLWFPCALGPRGCNQHPQDPHIPTDPRLQRLAHNLLDAMLAKHFG